MEEKKWTHGRKILLLTIRLQYEAEFNSKKKKNSALWKMVFDEVKKHDPDFPFNTDEIYKKFLNLMSSYRRIKRKNGKSGEGAILWEYYEMMDEVYGTRACIVPREEILDCSILENDEIFSENFEPVPSASSKKNAASSSRPSQKNEILAFLEKEAAADKQLFKDILEIENKKLLLEQERIKQMQEMKQLFASFIEKTNN